MIIGVTGNTSQSESRLPAIGRLLVALSVSGAEVVVEERFYDYVCRLLGGGVPAMKAVDGRGLVGADMILSLGGDGTLLRTAALVGASGVPVAGINSGHLGYLAGVDIVDAPEFVGEILEGRYETEPRSLLAVELEGGAFADDFWPYALNEVAILRHDTASMIDVSTVIDGRRLADYRGDGLIVSTPTGSTGYNLSIGGPIIEPQTPAWVVSPIAPHSLTMRPLVVNDSSVIEIATGSRVASYRLSLDGRSVTLPLTTRVRVRKAPFSFNVVNPAGHSFATTLRRKLLWGVR